MENGENKKAIKVLVISDYNDYHISRPEAYIFIGLAKLGFEIDVMTVPNCAIVPEFEAAGIKVIDFHPKKKLDRKEIKRIREALINEAYDVVHLFNNFSIVNGIRAAKNLPVKVVLYRGYSDNIHWYDPTAYLKFLHPRVDKIFCNSVGVEQHLHDQLFFDKSKTIVINKGHDLAWYEGYAPIDIKKEIGIPEDAFLLINVANNRKMKGIPYLLASINSLPKELNIHLLLVGGDMDVEENLNIIKQGDKADRIHILGFRKDVLNIVAASDVFCLSSITGESITKSVLEAMSLGVTPIITDIPGNVELLVHEESGLVTKTFDSQDMTDAIVRLYNDREFCKELGKNAKHRIATRLSTTRTIEQTKALYEGLVS
ncbi:MAG: glycosyltransferase family 4 protein [Flavobacteriales bacterium]|nr:glycosyltransferase family 4 protein [Flavobacteriales bacterium]